MNKEPDVFERVRQFFVTNPRYFGIILIAFGIFMLLAAINNWNWVFQGYSFNTKKLEGISNMWGRGWARAAAGLGGVVCIIVGIVWFAIYAFHYKQ